MGVEVHYRTGHVVESDDFFAFLYMLPAGLASIRLLFKEKDSVHRFDNLVVRPAFSAPEGTERNMVDGDRRTSVSLLSGNSAVFAFPDNGLSLINAYSIELGDESQSKPVSWKLEASRDGSTWTILDARDSSCYFSNRKLERFVLNGQFSVFQLYKLSFLSLSASTPIQIAEVTLEQLFQEAPTMPYIAYSSRALSFYLGETNILVSPLMTGFSSFAIEGDALPPGLTFSTLSGEFGGSIPSSGSVFSAIFQISATYQSGAVMQGSASIQVTNCDLEMAILQVDWTFQGESRAIDWDLRWNNELVLRGMGNDENRSGTKTICLMSDFYEFSLHNRGEREWPAGSHVSLSILPSDSVQSVPLGGVFLPWKQRSLTVPLSISLYSSGRIVEWTYARESAVPENWFSTYSSVQWSLSGEGLQLARSVWLFRRTFNVGSMTGITLLEFRVFCRAGLVVYVNEQPVHRVNVPEGSLSESTIATKIASPYWHVFTASATSMNLHTGSNLITIAAVNTDSAQITVDFKAIVLPLAHTGVLSRLMPDDSLQVSANLYSPNHPASNLIDSNLASFYQSGIAVSSSPEITISLQNDRVETFNQYCITAAEQPFYHPIAWVLEGRQSNSTEWAQLSEVPDAFFHGIETKCMFFTPSTHSNYRLKVLEAKESRTLVEIAEFGLNHVELSESSIPTLQMSVSEINAYLNAEFIAEYTVTSGYSSFAVSPALPSGLGVDPSTGKIFGIPTETRMSWIYTLTARFGEQEAMTSFSLRVLDCENSGMYHTFLSINLTDYSESTIRLVLQNKTHTFIHDSVAGPSYRRSLCVPQNQYRLFFLYQTASSPHYAVTVQNETFSGILEATQSSFEMIIDTQKLIHPSDTVWHYWIQQEAPPTNWYQSSLSSDWPSSRPGYFPSTTGVTSYFCTSFSASYTSYASAFLVGVFTRGGYIMYLNGIEINRVRLPAGEVSHSTLAVNSTSSASYVLFSGSIQFLPFVVDPSVQVEGGAEGDNNRLCIEEHHPTDMIEPSQFTVYMEYVQAGTSRIIDGWHWGSVQPVGTPWFEYVENAFDDNINTKYFGPSSCEDVTVRWTYWNDRKEFVNYLKFYAGNSSGRRPKELRLEGFAVDHWESLFKARDLVWENIGQYGQFKEWQFNNTQSYSAYQLVANGCATEGIEFAEVYLQALRVNVACEAADGFAAANEGEESKGPCPDYHSGYATRICLNGHFTEIDYSTCIPYAPTTFEYIPKQLSCFTQTPIHLEPIVSFHVDVFGVNPGLPVGVTFNVNTGVISGTPLVASVNTYTVTARNIRGTSKTTIFLSIQSGCPAIGDFPATPIGKEAVYNCGSDFWVLGSVRRRCEEENGMPVWGAPQGYCQNGVLIVVTIVLGALIIVTVVLICYLSTSVSKNIEVYELPNGEYELEDTSQKEGEKTVVRTRARMKLIGRPVFIYLPRYFHKSNRDYAAGYRRMSAPSNRRRSLERTVKV